MPEIQLGILETQLGSLHAAMDKLRAAAALDFGPVTRLVKSYFTNLAPDAEQHKNYAAVVHELQYYDLLHQTIDHIQALHQRLKIALAGPATQPETNSPVIYSLAQLNRLQFEVGCLGLSHARDEILRLLKSTPTDKFPDDGGFENQATMHSLATTIGGQFQELSALCGTWSAADVQPRMTELNMLYSTDTERAVLEQFMKEPGISAARIVETIQQARTESFNIDLF